MTSLSEVIATIDRILVQVSNASDLLGSAESLWIDAAEQLSSAVAGSGMAEAGELARLDDIARLRFADVRTELGDICDRVAAYRRSLLGDERLPDQTVSPEPTVLEAVTAPDGSRYSSSSAWCLDLLPPRVVVNNDHKTVGYVAHAPIPFVSGRDDTWTSEIVRRMRELGIATSSQRRFLSTHVELKVATMMVMQGRRHCEVTINHVPCRAGRIQPLGCHDVLSLYLPKGYTLTVHGTTQQGEPLSQTYEGQA
ncbi:DddA-like double-stranded DNA deaminase toxin [Lentzea sp. NBRC 102530]|uniref:DddA-like double-stranded DNA deaminase toxin n=1 Tax=Lentzea sp. NBRC 102530 TaxID=3032201 RepID=UPI0024A43BE1|nr:DddA-like double-stranded DNA deaminase toxin [Lentzea sp. NBRC 102530]GLY52074.1 hypothetical protein Lesp01_57300 [Lentzea sp. NBRC 102530]